MYTSFDNKEFTNDKLIKFFKKKNFDISSKRITQCLNNLKTDGIIKRAEGFKSNRWEINIDIHEAINEINNIQDRLVSIKGKKIETINNKIITTINPKEFFSNEEGLLEIFRDLNNDDFKYIGMIDESNKKSIQFGYMGYSDFFEILITFFSFQKNSINDFSWINQDLVVFQIELKYNEYHADNIDKFPVSHKGGKILLSNKKQYSSFINYLRKTKKLDFNNLRKELIDSVINSLFLKIFDILATWFSFDILVIENDKKKESMIDYISSDI